MDLNKYPPDETPVLVFANFFLTGPHRACWGPRTLSDYEFIYIVKGAGYYFDDLGNNLDLKEHDVLLIPPSLAHTFACDRHPGTVISCIHFLFSTRFMGREPFVISAERDGEILAAFRRCAEEAGAEAPLKTRLQNHTLAEIIIRLARAASSFKYKILPLKIRQAQLMMERRYGHKLGRKEIAAYLEITPEYLNALFKKHCNASPMDYLEGVRIRTAKILLKNPGWNISQVASEVGFDDPLYFSRVFRKVTGMAPKNYSKAL